MKLIKKIFLESVFIVLIWLVYTPTLQAKSFTTANVVQDSHSYQCLSHRIVMPICIYLHITVGWSGISVRFHFRDRIRHKLPDLVVSSYEKPGNNPWTEMRLAYGQGAVAIQNSYPITSQFENHGIGGAEHENKLVSRSLNASVRNKRFHEANVFGSPAPAVVRNTMKFGVLNVLGGPYLCKSNVQKFRPYFMSEPDSVAWRKPELEVNQQWRIAGAREIGSKSPSNLLGNTWGKVIPRTGYVMQTEPAKAAAVVAQRAIDLVTQKNQIPHIYQSYGTSPGEVMYIPTDIGEYGCNGDNGNGGGFGVRTRDQNCVAQYNAGVYPPSMRDPNNGNTGGDNYIDWSPPSLDESCPMECYGASSSATQMPASNEKDPNWQMISPVRSSSCEAFGSSSLDWAKDKNNEQGQYAWNYWREYECCKPAPGTLLNP